MNNKKFCEFFKDELREFVSVNKGSVDDPRMFWGALKGFIRNTAVSFLSHQSKIRLGKINELEAKLKELEHKQQISFTDTLKLHIDATRSELNSLLKQRAEFLILRTRRNYYFNGPRPSHLLALRLRQNEKYSNITSISSVRGLPTVPKEINTEFRNFFL